MYDLLILGNGAIGLFTAYNIIERGLSEKLKIGIIGDPQRKWGATVAAGAMHAVFAELEEFKSGSLEEQLFSLGLKSRPTFENIFTKVPRIKTADKTYVYLKHDASEFETRNFNTVRKIASEYSTLINMQNHSTHGIFGEHAKKHAEIICLDREYGFDARKLVKYIDFYINGSGIQSLDADITRVKQYDRFISVETNKGNFKAKKIINALGSRSNDVMPSNLRSIRQYQGVGTAFIIDKHELPSGQSGSVIRTVNRGGAQCGIHVVPLSNGFYVGAGNYVDVPGEPALRLDTLRYLLDMAASEILTQELTYKMTGSVVQGNRPRSLDGYPIFGETSDSRIVFATAFNRVALTCAPAISEILADWLVGENEKLTEFKDWSPNRSPISYVGAKNEFILSRVSNALEHALIENDARQIALKINEFEAFFDHASVEIKKALKFDKDFEIHPDMYGPLLNEVQHGK